MSTDECCYLCHQSTSSNFDQFRRYCSRFIVRINHIWWRTRLPHRHSDSLVPLTLDIGRAALNTRSGSSPILWITWPTLLCLHSPGLQLCKICQINRRQNVFLGQINPEGGDLSRGLWPFDLVCVFGGFGFVGHQVMMMDAYFGHRFGSSLTRSFVPLPICYIY